MHSLTGLELGYLAAMVDHHAHIGLAKYANGESRYGRRFSVFSPHAQVIDRLIGAAGLGRSRPHKTGVALTYEWRMTAAEGVAVLKAAHPLLCVERPRADLYLEFDAIYVPTLDGLSTPDEQVQARRRVYERYLDLNPLTRTPKQKRPRTV